VVAAEVMPTSPGIWEPMLDAAQRELHAAGVTETPGVLLADAGYWHQQLRCQSARRGRLVECFGGGRRSPVRLLAVGVEFLERETERVEHSQSLITGGRPQPF
jgi:hypothetical protein